MPLPGVAQDSAFHFKTLSIRGNKRSKTAVFLREIGYKPGDTIQDIAAKTILFRQRLSGIMLFNWVAVEARHDTLHITVKERQYTWGLPRGGWADRNFNVWWQNRDPDRLYYGATLFFNNLYGLNHSLQITAIRGYNQQLQARYSFPFASHSKGLSLIAEGLYLQNHELWYKTENDRLQFFRSESGPVQKNLELKTTLRKRLNFYNNIELLQAFRNYRISDSAYAANPNYLLKGTLQNSLLTGLYFNSDHRVQRDYPVAGYLFRAGLQSHYLWNKSAARVFPAISLKASHFSPLGKNWVLAKFFGAYYMFGDLPYTYSRQLGYQSDYVRGYEPFVADGNGFVLGKLALRKALFNHRPLNLNRLMPINNYKKMPLSIWFSIFADAGHVLTPSLQSSNPLNERWLAGTGIGMDIIVYYSTMMRLDYSMNRNFNRYFNLSLTNAF